MLFLLCVLILKPNTAVSQFPNHLDFEKVGVTTFKNNKYNILRPTVHMVRDYFQDFMLRKGNSDFPTKRVFIDDSGFRHYWSGLEEHNNNLRKANALETEVINDKTETLDNNLKNDHTTSDVTESIPILTTYPGTKVATDDDENLQNQENKSGNEKDIKENKEEATQGIDEIETTTRKHPKRKKKLQVLPMPDNEENLLRDGKERTVVKTTFFCPFFGVMTMQSYLDPE